MSAKKYIQSVIICDEVRTEMTGKDIAIGIYNSHLIVPQIPFVVPMLAIRYELNFHGDIVRKMDVKLEDPAQNVIIQNTAQVQFADWDRPGAVTTILGGLIIPVEGTYSFYSKFGDEWELVKTLLVEKVNQEKMVMDWHARMAKILEHMEKSETVGR